jgi:hypothetical protein
MALLDASVFRVRRVAGRAIFLAVELRAEQGRDQAGRFGEAYNIWLRRRLRPTLRRVWCAEPGWCRRHPGSRRERIGCCASGWWACGRCLDEAAAEQLRLRRRWQSRQNPVGATARSW